MEGHQAASRIQDTTRKQMYWGNMENDSYATVKYSLSGTSTRGTRYNQQNHLKLFSASGPLQSIAMDVWLPLTKTDSENKVLVVMTDIYSKIARDVPTVKTTESHIESRFLDNWICAYGIPRYILSDHGSQFVSKLFTVLRGFFGCKKLETKVCHSQTNLQPERNNGTIAVLFLHYVAEHQSEWDTFYSR